MPELLILNNVQRHVKLKEQEKQFFLSLLETRQLKKKELLLERGEVCRYSTFIISGAMKGYTVDIEGSEHVIHFAVSDWWIADLYSLISQKPAVMYIEALADSQVLMLSRENQELLFSRLPVFERFFRILTENALVASQERLINNLSLTAAERYNHFVGKYPFILQCAPLHTIASYLGITPEFLSKIRRKLAGRAV